MATKKSKCVNFSPNEAAAYTDMNDVQKALTQRAWEMPGYSDVLTPQRFVDVGGASYGGAFDSPVGLRKVVFTKGAGMQLVGSLDKVYITSGFIGTWNSDTGPAEFDLTAPTTPMRWAMFSGGGTPSNVTVALPAGALERYSLIEATITEAAEEVVARHFKDAATGALSSASSAKRRALTITLFANDGAAAAAGTAVIPTLTAGRSLVAYTFQNSSGIQQTYDCTVPFGPLRTRVYQPNLEAGLTNTSATIDKGGVNLLATTSDARFFLSGDPSERVLGFEILHKLQSGATIHFYQRTYDAGAGLPLLAELTPVLSLAAGTDFTADGTLRTLFINAVGKPIGADGVKIHPLWANGAYAKFDTFSGYANDALAIIVYHNNASASSLLALRAYTVGA